jgi:RimJ/RimL family protein N-acetyltransferase
MLVLKTERLSLRWARPEDAEFICELLNEPSWLANIGDRGVRTPDDARVWIEERLLGNCWRQGFGFWVVERTADGALLGICGLVLRDGLPNVDVGYALLPRFWGAGYAREAAAASLRYGADVLGLTRLLAITSAANAASARVLEAIGMHFEGLQQLPDYAEPSRLFGWTAVAAAPLDDRAQIELLLQKFSNALSNRHGLATLAALPHWLLPQASLTRGSAAGLSSVSLQGFMTQRAHLLMGERLLGFEEQTVEQRIEVFGRVAQAWLRYRRSGQMDGTQISGEGFKSLQLLKTEAGWKIASLAWQDLP